MEKEVHLIVYKRKSVFDSILVTRHVVIQNSKKPDNGKLTVFLLPLNSKGIDAYLASLYIATIKSSDFYRKCALQKLCEFAGKFQHFDNYVILLKLLTPKRQFLDYKWNERTTRMALERREIDNAMSWLSTLGGAFSALGEEFDHCAQMAGKISIKQFELALRLGDPLVVARCKLYASLSLIQRGHLNLSRHIIQDIYRFAKKEKDTRLQNMCHGIWAKLKYYRYKRKKMNKSVVRVR